MLVKFGLLSDVRNVFAAMNERSFVSWTVLLAGVNVLLSWQVLIMEYCGINFSKINNTGKLRIK